MSTTERLEFRFDDGGLLVCSVTETPEKVYISFSGVRERTPSPSEVQRMAELYDPVMARYENDLRPIEFSSDDRASVATLETVATGPDGCLLALVVEPNPSAGRRQA